MLVLEFRYDGLGTRPPECGSISGIGRGDTGFL